MNTVKNIKKYKTKYLEIATLKLTTTEYDVLDKFILELKNICEKYSIRYTGPASLSTRKLKIAYKRSPSGEGSGTYYYYKQNVWRKCIKIYSIQIVDYILKRELPASLKLEIVSNL
jgi:ribosomal protein S10